jgi:glycosyltransferase involved in cell wall biosynthesis
MRVGVFFPGFDSTSGGGYTFEQEILQSLMELASDSRHDFLLYFGASPGETEKTLPATKDLKIQWVESEKPVPPARLFLSEIAVKLGWRSLVITPKFPLQKAVERDQVQLLWFATCIYWPVEIPYIATVWDIQHRLQPWFPEVSHKGIWGWDYRETYYTNFLRRAAYIITPNQAGQDELSFFYQIPAERFRRLTHPAPRIERIPSQEEVASVLKKYNLSTRYLFYPAQFWAHKNHVNLLKALSILREKHQMDLDLVLTGFDQGNLHHIQTMIENLHLKEHVRFLNFIPREDLIALYAGAVALTYVTYFGPENLPPLEAFACGCPVVASDVPGAAEQLGDAALRVNASRPEEIALAVRNIYDDSRLRTGLIEKGLARAKEFTGLDYVRCVFTMIDDFEAIRSNWP